MRRIAAPLCLSIAVLILVLPASGGEKEPKVKDKPLSHWIKGVQSENRGLQLRASRALKEAKKEDIPKIVPKLLPLLSADRENTRFPVAQVLGGYGPPARQAVPHLLPMLKGTQFERNRAAAVDALGRILKDAKPSDEVEKVTQAIVAVFPDQYEDVRREAAVAIGRIGPAAKSAVKPLGKLLNDRMFPVRGAAAWACGRLGKHAEMHIDKLISMMHGERDIATTVVYAIRELGPVHENVMPNVVDRLEKTFYAQWGGFRVGARSYCVGEITKGTTQEYQWFCFDALARHADKAAVAVGLMERVISEKGWNSSHRFNRALGAVKVLKAIGPKAKSAAPKIKAVLDVKRWDNRIPKDVLAEFKKTAQEALEAVTGKKPEN
jgi:HEAT repeat protein